MKNKILKIIDTIAIIVVCLFLLILIFTVFTGMIVSSFNTSLLAGILTTSIVLSMLWVLIRDIY